MYHNALIAIDGSEISPAVLDEVPHLLDPKGNATVVEVIDDLALVLAHTVGGLEVGMAIDPTMAEEIVASQRALAEADLAGARRQLEALGVKHIRTVVSSGLPGPTIVEEARSRRSDVVVMGTHGRSGFKRALLGSVADHVLRHVVGVPLLLVRPDEHATQHVATVQTNHQPIAGR